MMHDDWQTMLDKGISAIRQQQPELARSNLQRAYKLVPAERQVRYWLANALRMNGETTSAIALFRQLLLEDASDADTVFALAFLFRELGQPADASHVLLQFSEQLVDADTQLKIVGFLRDSDQFYDAIIVMRKVVAMQPSNSDHYLRLARLYQTTGEFPQAATAFRKALDINPAFGNAWLGLVHQVRYTDADHEDVKLLKHASSTTHGDEADMCIAFSLGKVRDDLQQWPQAWVQFQKGNQYSQKIQVWDNQGWLDFVSQTVANPATPQPRIESNRHPVFIVGMLRSGTTLLEQQLDMHSQIQGRGELNSLSALAQQYPTPWLLGRDARHQLAAEFWKQMRRDGSEETYYIDKNPLNFRFLNVLLAILPEAKIVHIKRDGRDSCLSCFSQLFQHPQAAFSNKLQHVVDYYVGYRRLMDKWRGRYPEHIYECSYEELVRSPDTVVQQVLSFLGAGESTVDRSSAGAPGVEVGIKHDTKRPIRTASIWQARQAVHLRSVARWKQYYEQAPWFFDRLAEIDQQFATRFPD